MVLDAADTDKVGVLLGWLSLANTAGFAVGPVVGGVLYNFGGWWAVFGFILGMIGIDICLRCTIIERRRSDQGERPRISTATDIEPVEVSEQTVRRGTSKTFALFVLLRQPRMLCLLCGVIGSGIVVSSFDTVSHKSVSSILNPQPY